jgi:enoyl-CoA hydratase/carnithine racemase
VEKHLIEATADGVATLTLNRPEQLNALSIPIMEGRWKPCHGWRRTQPQER